MPNPLFRIDSTTDAFNFSRKTTTEEQDTTYKQSRQLVLLSGKRLNKAFFVSNRNLTVGHLVNHAQNLTLYLLFWS